MALAPSAFMARWLLAAGLAALLATGCDLPLDGLRSPSVIDAGGDDVSDDSADVPPPAHVDAGVAAVADSGARETIDATSPDAGGDAPEAGPPDSSSRGDEGQGDDAGNEDGGNDGGRDRGGRLRVERR